MMLMQKKTGILRVLTIDEDCLFDCTNQSLDFFPRIRSVEDYSDEKYLRKEWENYYDHYEDSFQLKLSPLFGTLLQALSHIGSMICFNDLYRVDTHDEALSVIQKKFRGDEIYLVNFDQHHDQFIMHGVERVDCSNWASPQVMYREFKELDFYRYSWIPTSLTQDFEFVKEYPCYHYSAEIIEDIDPLIRWCFYDAVIFCRSMAYVPSNYWEFFDDIFQKMIKE